MAFRGVSQKRNVFVFHLGRLIALYKYWHMTDQLEAKLSALVVVMWLL